jgi:hypothetical protein
MLSWLLSAAKYLTIYWKLMWFSIPVEQDSLQQDYMFPLRQITSPDDDNSIFDSARAGHAILVDPDRGES